MIKDIENLDGWNIVGLPDIVFFQEGPGVRNNQYTDSGVKLINVANLKDGKVYLENTERYISEEEAYGRYRHFLVDEGDLIIASSGIKVEYFDKKMGFINKEHLPLCMNTSTIRFKTLDENILDIKYFAYFLKTIYFKKQIARLITGSAQLNFGPSHLKKIKVILPPLNIQKKIVEVLEKSQYVINKRSEQIEELELLVKSKFIEMFGDPVLNPKSWNVKRVIDVCDCMVPGRDKPKSFTGNTPWITIEDLEVNSITYKSKSNLALTDDEINEVKRKKVPKNSVLMSCVGNLGICSIAGKEMIINQQLHSFQCKDINNFFLMHYLGFRKDYMISQASSTTVLYMNKTTCNSIPVYLPPIELQNQFSEFVKQVDKLKFEIEQSLKELEDNFNSLMQKAFKGELFN
ncbi:restriction endonuclease subunit S [Clostridium perfringens]